MWIQIMQLAWVGGQVIEFVLICAPDRVVKVVTMSRADDAQRFICVVLTEAHDLAVVEHISDEVVVLCRGEVVETASAEMIYREPKHEYTRNLLASVPTLD